MHYPALLSLDNACFLQLLTSIHHGIPHLVPFLVAELGIADVLGNGCDRNVLLMISEQTAAARQHSLLAIFGAGSRFDTP